MAAADREKVEARVITAIPDISSDEAKDYVNQAKEYFLAKTGHRSVPDRATYLWGDIAIAIGRSGQVSAGSAISSQIVTSVKRGDTTIEYGGNSGSSGSGSSSSGLSGIDARIAMFKVARCR
jgi:hypothetical protein